MTDDVRPTPAHTLTVFVRHGHHLTESAHAPVAHSRDPATELRAIIAVHDASLSPAHGGPQFFPLADESLALTDVLRLSEGMTHKVAVAGMPLSGGKAVIIGDPATQQTEPLLESYGRFVSSLPGRYSTALGVFVSLSVAAEMEGGETGVADRRVGVKGVCKVGHVIDLLLEVGARVTVSDRRPAAPAALGRLLTDPGETFAIA